MSGRRITERTGISERVGRDAVRLRRAEGETTTAALNSHITPKHTQETEEAEKGRKEIRKEGNKEGNSSA